MFWENFVSLCANKGVAPNTVAAELSLSSGSVTAWKNGTTPRETTLRKIADYFNVSVADLTSVDKKENPTASGGAKEILLNSVENTDDMETLLAILDVVNRKLQEKR